MTTLENGFEAKLQEAVLDKVEDRAVDIGRDLRDVARARWISYAADHGYSIEHIWTDVEGPFVDRDGDSVTIRLEWPRLTALFEWGVQPHTIHGNPLLHFYIPEDDQWVITESVDHPGLPASRAIRDTFEEAKGV